MDVRRPTRRRWRLYAGPADEPRARRATDVIELIGALSGLAFLSATAVPPAGFEQALITFLRAIPSGLDGLWELLADLAVVVAGVLIVACVVRRRWALLRDLALAGLLALGGSLLLADIAFGDIPHLWPSIRAAAPPPVFAAPRLAVVAAIVFAAAAHLTRTARRLSSWLVVVATLSVAFLGASTPGGTLAAVLVGVAAAALVHLAFGSTSGRPSLDDVSAALAGVGVADAVASARRPPARRACSSSTPADTAGDPLRRQGLRARRPRHAAAHDGVAHGLVPRAGSPTSGRAPAAGRARGVPHLAGRRRRASRPHRSSPPAPPPRTTSLLVLRPVGQPAGGRAASAWSDALVAEVWRTVRPAARHRHRPRPARRSPPRSSDGAATGRRRSTSAAGRWRRAERPPAHRSRPRRSSRRSLAVGRGAGPGCRARRPRPGRPGRRAAVRAGHHPDAAPARAARDEAARPGRPPRPGCRAGRRRAARARAAAPRQRGARSSRSCCWSWRSSLWPGRSAGVDFAVLRRPAPRCDVVVRRRRVRRWPSCPGSRRRSRRSARRPTPLAARPGLRAAAGAVVHRPRRARPARPASPSTSGSSSATACPRARRWPSAPSTAWPASSCRSSCCSASSS